MSTGPGGPPASAVGAAPDAAVYIPGLTHPNLFSALPSADSVATLISRHIAPQARPRRDLSGEPRGRPVPELIAGQAWRAVATWAKDAIVEAEPTQTELLLDLWVLRLTALQSLHLPHLHASELSGLLHVLVQTVPYDALVDLRLGAERPLHPVVPFPLLVMKARAWERVNGKGGEGRLRALDGLKELMEGARRMAVKEAELQRTEGAALWRSRTQRLALLLSSLLAGLDQAPGAPGPPPPCDPLAASALLEELPADAPAALSARAKLHLALGDLQAAARAIDALEAAVSERGVEGGADAVRGLRGLKAASAGEWERAAEIWEEQVGAGKGGSLAVNNLAVCLLYSGKISQALATMSDWLLTPDASSPPSPYDLATDPYIFNLSTMLELRSNRAVEAKRELLCAAASKAALETTKAGVFKLA